MVIPSSKVYGPGSQHSIRSYDTITLGVQTAKHSMDPTAVRHCQQLCQLCPWTPHIMQEPLCGQHQHTTAVLLVLVLCAGTVSCFIMERFAPGVNFMLSADLDHAAKNYKFGFGFSAGE